MFSKVTKAVACFGSAVVILSSQKLQAKELIACHDCHMKRLPKAKELPIYEKKEDFILEYDEKSTPPLLSEISVVRKKLFEYGSYINIVQEKALNIYETGLAHSKSSLDSLKDEENKVQRVLIIASGGLFGLLFARRGGVFKKTLYASLGTGAVFSVFYPALSKEYAVKGWNFSKDQINHILTKYGGYDTDKIAKEANEKIDYIKSAMKFEPLLKMLNEKFYKKDSSKEDEKNKEIIDNKDMYTTRAA